MKQATLNQYSIGPAVSPVLGVHKVKTPVRLKGQSGIWRNHPEETGGTLDSRGYTSSSGVQGIPHLNTDTTHHEVLPSNQASVPLSSFVPYYHCALRYS